ncbi:Phosphoribosylformylglycinamidine synthase subunit PurQ [Paraconexibacter sp. AEG42_29]|uniref:Phosphoribosylformylglycinamidine synthase subunit PurQ n=1 Tax=Paraconexibacter sp. AEG42_29 TaxID=2997339 RepID=A0AAU7APF5_9ACTN
MKFGVVQFPGSCDERDAIAACETVDGAEAVLLWHRDADLHDVDAIVIPGGFSFGDYLRCGAIAQFSPVMASVITFANSGGPVVGICNGFQVLCETGLLPGTLLPNEKRRFLCRQLDIEVADTNTPFTRNLTQGDVLSIPSKHQGGRYYAPEPLLEQLEADGQVVFRYANDCNPNGSLSDIAGVCNVARNVVGLMPHPEHAVDPRTGSDDALALFASLAGGRAYV